MLFLAKKICGTVLFGGGLVFALVFLGVLFNPEKASTVGFNFTEFKQEKQPIDIMFFGSSFMYCSFSPMEAWKAAGLTSYVAAGPEQGLNVTCALMEEIFKYSRPRCVVLELRGLSFETAGEKPSAEYYSPGEGRINGWYDKLSQAASGKKIADGNYFYDFFTFHNRWKELTAKDFEQVYQALKSRLSPSFYKGYVPLLGTRGTIEVYDDDIPEPNKFFAQNLRWLEQIKAMCAGIGAEAVFLVTPSANVNYFDRYLEEVAELYPDTRIVDLNARLADIGFDLSRDMYDGGHPNFDGAVKCTRYLVEYLKFLGLKDNRATLEYSQWNKQLALYEKAMSEIKQSGGNG
ncbi:MAG: hypothetical protein LBS62_13395 [Clostridiales bacterium]|jgi:hypothetical protein|nr:hypothetical protein [Clostridiales bacterium]